MHKNKSEAAKCRWQDPEYRRKMSEAHKNNWQNLEYRYKMSKARKGYKRPLHSLETKHKISEACKRNWQDPDFVQRMLQLRQIKPNRAERKLDAILQEVCFGEFALNTRAEIMTLGGRVPDFVNMNGKKQLIELFGDYWHNPKRFPDKETPQERIDYFKQFGDWDTLIIWEHELKDEVKLQQKLLAFMGKL